jgi:hypothetical protein
MTDLRRDEPRNRKGGARAPPFLLGLLLLGQVLGGGAVAGQATGSLVGRIQDAETGAGIPDASVALGTEFLALTDSAGFFAIGDIPPGEHTLRVVHIAYGEFDRLVTLAEGEELGLRIHLSRTTIELEPVIVEALTHNGNSTFVLVALGETRSLGKRSPALSLPVGTWATCFPVTFPEFDFGRTRAGRGRRFV